MVCHMHQPNVFVNSFYGTIMWDYESDSPFMWPKEQKHPTDAEARAILDRNPEEAARSFAYTTWHALQPDERKSPG